MSFTYDVFISYKREDAEWAKRIGRKLEGRGLRVFIDTNRLQGGTDWPDELQSAVYGSQHMIVLASKASRDSDWVTHEMLLFRPLPRQSPGTPRRLIPVLLDDDPELLRQFQFIDDILRSGAYGTGPDSVPAKVWESVLDKLVASISSAELGRQVQVLVVSTTRAGIENVDPQKPVVTPIGGPITLDELIVDLGVDRDALLSRYGTRRRDWRPFGSAQTVSEILEGVQGEINEILAEAKRRRFTWTYLDDDFWEGSPERIQAAGRLLGQRACLIVLDPVALYDDVVRVRTNEFLIPKIEDNDQAVVMVLPPFEMSPTASALRRLISLLAYEFFDAYRNPPVFSTTKFARYLTSVGDEVDLKAWLLTGLAQALGGEAAELNGNAWLRAET